MDQSEKVTLLSGDGTSSYIGQVPGIPDLCIPPINMEDGPSGGAAMAALIFGTVDPSGKLPVTFPASLSQVPAQTEAQWPGTSTGVDYVGVVNPYGYSSPKGAAVSFTMQAEDSDPSRALTFTATGLPPGITIAANGTISGSGSTLETYTLPSSACLEAV
jgi:hypothetical protein